MFIWDLIVFILGLSVLIMVHELGHFLSAKAFNVYCHEFSIGMGPVVVKTKKGETQYSIRALPIGGFVSMAGEGVDEATNIKKEDENTNVENNEVEVVEERPNIPYERTINGIAAWKRFIVISAGVIMNFIFSFIFLFIYIFSTGLPDGNVILMTEKDSIAYQAGITNEINVNGIEIIHVSPDGSEIAYLDMTDSNGVDSLSNYIDNSTKSLVEQKVENMQQCVVFRYEEAKENKYTNRVCRTFVTKTEEKDGKEVTKYTAKESFGIEIGNHYSPVGFGESIIEAGKLEWELGTAIFRSLGELFKDDNYKEVTGVVGIFSVSQQFQKLGFGYYMMFLGFISVNLGIMNLLPIPGLDGSQLIVIGIEGVTRRKISDRVKAIINGIGLIFLLGLMGLIMIKDIVGLF